MMASLSGQRAAVKFCYLLRQNASETNITLKRAYKDDSMEKLKCTSDLLGLKMAKCRLMSNLPESTKMLK